MQHGQCGPMFIVWAQGQSTLYYCSACDLYCMRNKNTGSNKWYLLQVPS